VNAWLERFRADLSTSGLLRGARRVLVGCSGGPDSTALLDLLAELRSQGGLAGPLELFVGHVHHGLRGPEADRDLERARSLAGELGLEFLVRRVEAGALASASSVSREVAARKLRFDAFRDWARSHALDAVALAHHLDDQAETVLLRAARGAGVRGLAGIPPSRPLGGGSSARVIRPLLRWRRAEILRFLEERGRTYEVDATNEDRSIPRNAVRHEALPLLAKAVHPGAPLALARLGELAREAIADLEALGERALGEALLVESSGAVELSVAALLEWPPSVVREALLAAGRRAEPQEGFQLSARAWRDVWDRLSQRIAGGASSWTLPARGDAQAPWEVDLRYGVLRVARGDTVRRDRSSSACGSFPCELGWGVWRIGVREAALPPEIPRASRAAGRLELVDADSVERAGPLHVRGRLEGDRFWPLGAPGAKKLKEFLRERRVVPRQRDGVPLLVAGSEIVWVVGHRIAHPFRVTEATSRVLVLEGQADLFS